MSEDRSQIKKNESMAMMSYDVENNTGLSWSGMSKLFWKLKLVSPEKYIRIYGDQHVSNALREAVKDDRPEVVQLLAARPDFAQMVQEPFSKGKSMLHAAAEYGNAEILDMMLRGGAELNLTDKQGNTPLMAAALQGNQEAVAVLLQNGASPDVPNKQGVTARQVIAQKMPETVVPDPAADATGNKSHLLARFNKAATCITHESSAREGAVNTITKPQNENV